MIQLNKCLFLDLDGTIIRTKSKETFPKDINDWEIIEGVLPAMKRYVEKGYIVCIVSNQGGIELGHLTEADMDLKLQDIRREVEAYIRTDVNVAYCPHMDGYYRKPNPGMAYYFAIELKINLRESVMVGDNNSDCEFAIMAGISGYLHVNQFRDIV